MNLVWVRALPSHIRAVPSTASAHFLFACIIDFECRPDELARHVSHQHRTIILSQSFNGLEYGMRFDILSAVFIWFAYAPDYPEHVETDHCFLMVELLQDARVHVEAREGGGNGR